MTVRLVALGAELATDRIASVIDAFRAAAEVRAGLVLPYDRAATADDLTLDPVLSTTGVLWSDDAECRWRIEGERAVVTVVADGPTGDALAGLEGLAVEQHEAEVEDSELPVAWVREPFAVEGRAGRFVERTYRTTAGPVHRRLHVTEVGGA